MQQAQQQTFSCRSLHEYLSDFTGTTTQTKNNRLLDKRFNEPHDNFDKLIAYSTNTY